MSEHTSDCVAVGDQTCRPGSGSWDQPPGEYVAEARTELDPDEPWCQVRRLAWELRELEPNM